MVGSISAFLTFTEETALTLRQNIFFPERGFAPRKKIALIPEIVEEREVLNGDAEFGYNRLGQLNRIGFKGRFINAYL